MPKGGWPEPESEKMLPLGQESLKIRDWAITLGQDSAILKSKLEALLEQAQKSGNEEMARDLKEKIAGAEEYIAKAGKIADLSEKRIIIGEKNKEFLEETIRKVKESGQ